MQIITQQQFQKLTKILPKSLILKTKLEIHTKWRKRILSALVFFGHKN